MYFLVILICLTINYVWLKDLDRFSDSWFFHFHRQVEKLTAETAQKSAYGWMLPLLLVYAVPLLAVAGLLLLVEDILFGMLVMLVHILVLLIAFDRTQPGKLANDFLLLWKQDDQAACAEFLRTEVATGACLLENPESEAMAAHFSRLLTYRCFEKMFVMFFWYMVTGPLGIVFCYVTYQLRDTQSDNAPDVVQRLNRTLLRILEWAPMRLLALSFALAGNFVKSFSHLRQFLWDFSLDSDYSELLYDLAGLALSSAGHGDTAAEESSAKTARITAEIEALQALLERSQLIWLSVLALITVFGINS